MKKYRNLPNNIPKLNQIIKTKNFDFLRKFKYNSKVGDDILKDVCNRFFVIKSIESFEYINGYEDLLCYKKELIEKGEYLYSVMEVDKHNNIIDDDEVWLLRDEFTLKNGFEMPKELFEL